MLHDVLAIAWLLSGVVMLFAHWAGINLLENVFQPVSLFGRYVLYAIVSGTAAFAVLGLLGYPCNMLGMPMMHWFSLFFLINLWTRAVYLFVKKRTETQA